VKLWTKPLVQILFEPNNIFGLLHLGEDKSREGLPCQSWTLPMVKSLNLLKESKIFTLQFNCIENTKDGYCNLCFFSFFFSPTHWNERCNCAIKNATKSIFGRNLLLKAYLLI